MTTIAFWEPVLPHHGLTLLFHTLILALQRGFVVRAQTQVPSAAFDNWCHALDVNNCLGDHGLTLVYYGERRPKEAPFWVAVPQSDAGLQAALDFADGTPGAGVIVGVDRDEPIHVPSYLPVRASAPIPFSHALNHAGRMYVNAWGAPPLASTPGARALRVAAGHILDVVESHRQLADLLTGIFTPGREGEQVTTTAEIERPECARCLSDLDDLLATPPRGDAPAGAEASRTNDAGRALVHLRAYAAGEAQTREERAAAVSIVRLPLDRWLRKLAASGLAPRCGSTSGELAEALKPQVSAIQAAARELRLSREAVDGFFRRPGSAWVLTFVRMALGAGRTDLLDLVDAAAPPTLRVVSDAARAQ